MIRVNDVKLPLDYDDERIKTVVSKQLKIDKNNIKSVSLFRRSIDARHKDSISFIAAIDVELKSNENSVLRRCNSTKISIAEPYRYDLPICSKLDKKPVVVGAGPAGLFAALILAQAGQCPILIERGKSVDDRTRDVQEFWSNGCLNTESNVQFGEGGAGTFSDGKLNTGTKDIRSRKVLTEFVNHGAPKEILYNAKPHIGTDKLKTTVKGLRNEIIHLGGEVRFETKLISVIQKSGRIEKIKVRNADNSTEEIYTDNLILALGHSARDTFAMLNENGFILEPKPFSVGVRIEHLQESINKTQYGKFFDNNRLGAADYKLNVHLNSGRGVYTFCMCPGGSVVAAASEENTVVTNGMSEFARDKENANSALLVGVSPSDFGNEHPLAGVEFQRKIERNAFIAGGGAYKAPVQRVGDFLKNRCSERIGSVTPSYLPGYSLAKVSDYLPDFVSESLREAIPLLNNRLHGFSDHDAILTGAETRSSSPVRIIRDEQLEAVTVKGVYPCGEGAGYAGGIISAAVDGIKCAEAILIKSVRR